MALAAGSRFGPYEILAPVGAGGMGEVYSAVDTRLKRSVAIKVLPAAVAHDPDRLARFHREAELLASLNHPHIAQIHGLEEGEGGPALVMELVEGPTLADRIAQGPLPVEQALVIARQIASALEAAHEQGIVHRDLKPANVKVRPDGTIKVLDFGLAKALAAPGHAPERTQGLTVTAPLATAQGVVFGTVAYMSPEQAAGGPVDQRSDIWALGCVLYEMLTGRAAFTGESAAHVLAKVLESDPDLDALPPATPVALRRLIGRCLKKDRGRRFHHVADVGLEIEDCLVDGGQAAEVEVPARKTATRRVSWSHVGVAVVSAVLAVLVAVRNGPETSRDVTRSILESLPATGGTVQGVAVSPGGRDVVYSAGGMLHWRSLGSESAPLPGTEGGVLPAFSRDGSSVAFFVPGESAIMRLAAATGQITRVTTTDGGAPVGLSWTPDDRIIYATTLSQGLRETPGLGGVSEPLTRVVAGDAIGHYWPSVLPDGRGVLIEVFRGGSSQVAVVSLETREVTPLVDVGGRPRLLPTGHLVYLRDDGLWAAAFDLRRQTLASPPVNVGGPRILGANFDVAADGSLVYVPDVAAAPSQELVWLDREGHEDPLDLPRGMYTTVRISPDEQRIVASLRPPGLEPPGLYVSDIDRPGFRPIATPAPEGGQWFPLWTPDSIDVLFGIYPTRDQVPAGLFRARADGTGTVEAVRTLPDSGFLDPRTWTPEGDLLFTYGPPGATRAGRLSLESAAWSPLFDGADGIWPSAVSPDGRWVVTERLREPGNQTDLYIEPFPGPGRPQPIAQSARNAVWSPDDPTVLFYRRTTDWAMMSVTVETTPVLSIGSPSEVIDLSPGHRWGQASRAWDVAKDGRFLMLKRVDANLTEESQQLRLIQNWTVELEDTLPADR